MFESEASAGEDFVVGGEEAPLTEMLEDMFEYNDFTILEALRID